MTRTLVGRRVRGSEECQRNVAAKGLSGAVRVGPPCASISICRESFARDVRAFVFLPRGSAFFVGF